MLAKYYTYYMKYYRVTAKDILSVSANPAFPEICFNDIAISPHPDWDTCTEDDFWETYYQVKEKLNKVVEQIPHTIKKVA